jgi:exosortase
MRIRLIAALACAALLVCYLPILLGMGEQWRTDEDMGHGFAVPLVAFWIVWRERDRWRHLPLNPSPWGFVLLFLGATFHTISAVGVGLFAGSVGFLLSVSGIVLLLGGFGYLSVWAFPLLLSVFMLPKLAVVYNMFTLPLQFAATRLAELALSLANVAVVRQGNILESGALRVAVVEACNGIRYLLSLAFAGVVFAYLSDPKPWIRVAMMIASVPIAIFANALRVALAVVLGLRNPKLAEEPYHSFSGWVIFVLCLVVMWACQWAINRVYERIRS